MKIPRVRYGRKSLQKGITEGFLNFLDNPNKSSVSEDMRKNVYFIVEKYVRAFFDKIKLPPLENKEEYFKGTGILTCHIIRTIPLYY